MSSSISAPEPLFQFDRSQAFKRDTSDQRRSNALRAELQASLARESALRADNRDLTQRQVMLTQEFEHRITNGLQLIAGLLSAQSRTMPTPEARIQLSIAARRVVALGAVHNRLHLLDQPANMDLKEFLVGLCDDLSSLLLQNRPDHAIVVEGTTAEIPSSLAGALGLITNELITNSVKHTNGDITVRLEKRAPAAYSLSVLDDGPGLAAGGEAAKSKGFGMKLVLWVVEQIGGELQINRRHDGHRACVTVTFCPYPKSV
jgi:two-component system, sensor histidine kinase PdtaS